MYTHVTVEGEMIACNHCPTKKAHCNIHMYNMVYMVYKVFIDIRIHDVCGIYSLADWGRLCKVKTTHVIERTGAKVSIQALVVVVLYRAPLSCEPSLLQPRVRSNVHHETNLQFALIEARERPEA